MKIFIDYMGWWLSLLMFMFLMSCSSTFQYKQYDPDYGTIEYRYNPSWGHYRHFYYRPVPYNDRWIYQGYYWNDPYWNRRIVVPYSTKPNKVKSKQRRGNVQNRQAPRVRPKSSHNSSSNQRKGRRHE